MSVSIETPDTLSNPEEVAAAVREYLMWCAEILGEAGAPSFDLDQQVAYTIEGIDDYLPLGVVCFWRVMPAAHLWG
ncbi:MAG: hypothetical protein HRU32_09545 [Rhodobacteraceae bacterium]|nr:hypothetical protein [Paracoccaceae bacterium]